MAQIQPAPRYIQAPQQTHRRQISSFNEQARPPMLCFYCNRHTEFECRTQQRDTGQFQQHSNVNNRTETEKNRYDNENNQHGQNFTTRKHSRSTQHADAAINKTEIQFQTAHGRPILHYSSSRRKLRLPKLEMKWCRKTKTGVDTSQPAVICALQQRNGEPILKKNTQFVNNCSYPQTSSKEAARMNSLR